MYIYKYLQTVNFSSASKSVISRHLSSSLPAWNLGTKFKFTEAIDIS